MNTDTAILEMIKRSMAYKETAELNNTPWIADSYAVAIEQLAIAYSLSMSEDDDRPLSIADVVELAKEYKRQLPY